MIVSGGSRSSPQQAAPAARARLGWWRRRQLGAGETSASGDVGTGGNGGNGGAGGTGGRGGGGAGGPSVGILEVAGSSVLPGDTTLSLGGGGTGGAGGTAGPTGSSHGGTGVLTTEWETARGLRMPRKLLMAVAACARSALSLRPRRSLRRSRTRAPSRSHSRRGRSRFATRTSRPPPSDPVIVSVTVQANGNVISEHELPGAPADSGPARRHNVDHHVIGTPSGHVNPLTGWPTSPSTIRNRSDGGGVGGNCHVGNITVNTSTANSGGVPYNPSTARHPGRPRLRRAWRLRVARPSR